MRQQDYLYTEKEYGALLDALLGGWRPVSYDVYPGDEWIALWRHDVDYSPHRALALAKLEAAKGISATYFFQLRSAFYNCLEPGMEELIGEIASLGHKLGLHFDARPYPLPAAEPQEYLAKRILHESAFFSQCFGVEVSAFSLHNPTVLPPGLGVKGNGFCNIPCADATRFHENFLYASDSRGGWRRSDLPRILKERRHKRLHVLTHPVRWTPEPWSARGTLFRHLDGWQAKKRKMLHATALSWEKPIDEAMDNHIQDSILND